MSDTAGDAGGDDDATVDGRRSGRSAHPDANVPNRRRAALLTLPFLALGLAVAALAVTFAPQPLWGFLLLPPVAFMSVLTYLTFRSDFLDER